MGGTGVWILIRTPFGYYATNPSMKPLAMREWKLVAGKLETNVYASGRRLEEHESQTQLYRSYRQGKKEIWHGVNAYRSGAETFEALLVKGEAVHRRRWDSAGRLEEVSKIPTSGHGFFVRWRDGRLLGFAHYIDGKKSGLSREYHRGTHFLRRETHWKGGVRHGWDRHFDDKGRPKTVQHFEKGFIPPVIRYRGKATGGATLHKGEGRLYYHAPRRIMRELHLRGVGMTTADVSRLLELDFSEKSGISFNSVGCETALHVEFDKGKVSKVYTLPNGAHCE